MSNGKDTYYFSHDANARNDEKILMLRAEHGWEGYGIFWALIEMMFENSDTCLSHNKIKGIAISYNIDITVLQSVINTAITEDLFISDGEVFWSKSLRRRKTTFQELREKRSKAGKKGMESRWGKADDKRDTKQCYSTVITKDNKGKESKGKESKVKESKEEDNTLCAKRTPYSQIMESFNSICTTLPPIKSIKGNRQKTVRVWYAELKNGMADVEAFFKRVHDSDFLSGRNDKWHNCSFDWIIKAANRQKIEEGTYDNRGAKKGTGNIFFDIAKEMEEGDEDE